MDANKIEILKNAMPDIFDMRIIPDNWDDEYYVIQKTEREKDPFEGILFPEEEKPSAQLEPVLF